MSDVPLMLAKCYRLTQVEYYPLVMVFYDIAGFQRSFQPYALLQEHTCYNYMSKVLHFHPNGTHSLNNNRETIPIYQETMTVLFLSIDKDF